MIRSAFRPLVAAVVLALAAGLLLLAPPAAVAAPAPAADDVTDGLLLRYDLDETTGTVVEDTSGNGRDGTVVGGGTWTGTQGLQLDGVDDHVRLPDNLTAGLTAITVSVDVFIEPSQAGNYFIYNLGNTAVGSPASGTGYLFATGNTFRATISNQWWNNERSTAPVPARALARGVWKTVTYTQTGTTGTLYEDGAQVGQNTSVSWTPAQIGGGTTTRNVLGESAYAADNTLKGKVRNFRIYDRALTPAEVSSISLTDANRLAADAAILDLGDLSAVTDDLTLPATGPYGSAISWESSEPDTIAADGTVTRPAAGADPVDVVLTATLSRGSATESKTFDATVLPAESDQLKADEAAAALEIVHADDVRGHLTMPTTGLHDATVEWASSDPDVVAPDGLVHRPAHGVGDDVVTVTATVTVGSATATRAIELTVRELPEAAEYEGYAFSYFVNNSVAGEKIYFAASRGNNALQWDELNDGEPVLESTFGELGLRDPFLIRSPEGDRFFLIATDLSIGRNGDWDRAQRQGSRYLEVWESTDLVNWSEQRHVLVSPPTAGNTWAPEAYWDESLQQYVVFWASKVYADDDPGHTGNTYNRMLYATTRDFVTFSPARVWQDIGSSRIDSTVIREDDTYYRFTKDEGAGTTGCSDIIQEKNDVLTEPDLVDDKAWEFQAGCIGRDAGTSAVEGPSIFKANPGDTSSDDYYLFVDEYGGRGYIPLGTDDLENPDWTVPPAYTLPSSPRHGTVIPVTAAELQALRDGLGAPEPPTPVEGDENGLVAHYPLTDDAADVSGHDYDGAVTGDATFADGALNLGGSTGHVKLPDDMMAGLDAITVSSKVWVDSTQSGNYFLWGLGNTGSDGAGRGYLFSTGNSTYRAAIASGNWTTEQGMTSGSALPRGAWKTVTYTLEDGVATLYLDGVQVGRNANVTIKPGDIGGGRTTANYIGRSVYTGDNRLQGKVQDFRIYNRALSASEVATLGAGPTDIAGVELDSLKAPAVIRTASHTIVLPVEPGTDLTSLDPDLPGRRRRHRQPRRGGRLHRAGRGHGDQRRPGAGVDRHRRRDALAGAAGSVRRPEHRRVRRHLLPLRHHRRLRRLGRQGVLRLEVDRPRELDPIDRAVPDARRRERQRAVGHRQRLGTDDHRARRQVLLLLLRPQRGARPQDDRRRRRRQPGGPVHRAARGDDPQQRGRHLRPGHRPGRVPRPGDRQALPLLGQRHARCMAELADDMTSLKPGTIQAMTGLTDYREGSFINYRQGIVPPDLRDRRHRFAELPGGLRDVRPASDGPWTYRGVILQKDESQGILGTGHSSIVQVPGRDEWYIAYHRFAIPGGNGTHRETTIDRLTFGDDGLIEQVVPTLTSVDPLVVEEPTPRATARPRVTGDSAVGGVLRATPGTWDTPGLRFSYRWLRDGRAVPGADARTFRVRPADVGSRFTVRVTASGDGLAPGTATSPPTRVVRRADTTVRAWVGDPTPRVNRWVRLTVRVVPDPAAAPLAGRIQVYVAGRRVATRPLDDGRAVLPIRATKRGASRVVVRYLGSAAAQPGQDALILRAHR